MNGHDARVQDDPRRGEAQVPAASDVDTHAAADGLEEQRMDRALTRDERARVLGERVRDDVAGIEQRHHLGDEHVGIDARPVGLGPQASEMDVDGNLGLSRGLLGQLQGLDAPARVAADFRVGLDALDDVAVLLDGRDRLPHVDAVGTVELGVAMADEPADEIVRDEREHPGDRRLHDELAKPLDRQRRRAALIDHGRHAGPDPHQIGIHAERAGDMFVDVGVRVDHPGDHEPVTDVERLRSRALLDRGEHRGDLPVADADVEAAVDPTRGVDHAAAAQHEVEAGSRGRGHARAGRAAGTLERFCLSHARKHTPDRAISRHGGPRVDGRGVTAHPVGRGLVPRRSTTPAGDKPPPYRSAADRHSSMSAAKAR